MTSVVQNMYQRWSKGHFVIPVMLGKCLLHLSFSPVFASGIIDDDGSSDSAGRFSATVNVRYADLQVDGNCSLAVSVILDGRTQEKMWMRGGNEVSTPP